MGENVGGGTMFVWLGGSGGFHAPYHAPEVKVPGGSRPHGEGHAGNTNLTSRTLGITHQ